MTQELQGMSQSGYAPSPTPTMQAPMAQVAMPPQSQPVASPQGLTTAIPSPSVPQSPSQMVAQWQQGQPVPSIQMQPQQYYPQQPTGQAAWAPMATPPAWGYTAPAQQSLGYQSRGIPAVTGSGQPAGVEELKQEYADYAPYSLEAAAYDSNARALKTLSANQQIAAMLQQVAGPVVDYWQAHGIPREQINPQNLGQAVAQLIERTVRMEQLLSSPDQLSKYFLDLDAQYQQQDPQYGEYAARDAQVRQMVEYLMGNPAMLQAVVQMIQEQGQQGQQGQQPQYAARQNFPAASPQFAQQPPQLEGVHPAQRWQAIRESLKANPHLSVRF